MRIPDDIFGRIQRFVFFPDQKPPNVEVQHLPQPTARGTIHLYVKSEVTYKQIITLYHDLEEFFKPIHQLLHFLTYFHIKESKMFKSLINSLLTGRSSMTCEELARVLNPVKEQLQCILMGTAVCEQAIKITRTMNENSIKSEIKILSEFSDFKQFSHKSTETVVQLQNALILRDIITNVDSLCQFCIEFDLRQCLEDENVIRLKEITKIMQQLLKESIITISAVVDEIQNLLFIKPSKDSNRAKQFVFLKLFKPLYTDTKELRNFLNENNFRGKGQDRFLQLLTIVTQGLQHEEYNAEVLNKLSAVFFLLSPLNNPDLSFIELLDAISKLDTSTCLAQLKTVNSNIDLIRMWFSKAEVYCSLQKNVVFIFIFREIQSLILLVN